MGWHLGRATIHGQQLAWQRAGAGPPVLYLHDAGAETVGATALARLARDHEVVVPWLPGYGRSPAPDPAVSPEQMGRLIGGLIDHLGWSRPTVAGASLGGWFALEAALAAPQRVGGLVVCDAAGLHVPEDHLMALFAGGHASGATQRLLTDALARALPPHERDVTALAPALAAATLGPFVHRLAAAAGCAWHPALANPRLLGRLPGVRCPATVVWGARDPLVPLAHGRAIACALPRGRLVVLDEVGHLPPLEAPTAFADAVAAMVVRVGRLGSTVTTAR